MNRTSRAPAFARGLALVVLAAMPLPAGAFALQSAAPEARGSGARIDRVTRGLRLPVEVRGRDPWRGRLRERMEAHHVPAVSVAVMEGGEIAWSRAWGWADSADGVPATPATRFQAASISKPVAALAALRLVEAGRVGLDEDIEPLLGGWRIPRALAAGPEPVTLRGLLSHSAGLTVHGFEGYAVGDSLPSTIDVLRGRGPANSPLVRVTGPPGAAWRYSGGGYTVVQHLVETLAGRPFAVVMRPILDALGMTSSTYEQPLPDSLASGAAAGHREDGSNLAGSWHVYPEAAAAGLWTTPTDVARFAVALGRWAAGRTGGVVSPELARTMLEPGLGGWGLGPAVSGAGLDLRFEHAGANEGYRSRFVYFPRRGIGAVVMTNGDDGGPLADEILFALSDEYGWPAIRPREVRAVPLATADAIGYTGTFRLDDAPDVRVVIRWRGGRLEIRVGDREPAELIPVAADRFIIASDGEELRFERDTRGRITSARAYGSRARRGARRPDWSPAAAPAGGPADRAPARRESGEGTPQSANSKRGSELETGPGREIPPGRTYAGRRGPCPLASGLRAHPTTGGSICSPARLLLENRPD